MTGRTAIKKCCGKTCMSSFRTLGLKRYGDMCMQLNCKEIIYCYEYIHSIKSAKVPCFHAHRRGLDFCFSVV